MSAVLAFGGCYDARRTAALSGVPRSTVYHWASKGIVEPSISAERQKLWSYADLIALRIVRWLRHPTRSDGDVQPGSAMGHVREALARLDDAGLDLWGEQAGASSLYVDPAGKIMIVAPGSARELNGRGALSEWLDVLGPVEFSESTGPDLRRPREHLRVVPGKCAGEAHLAGSRLTTVTIAALAERGYMPDDLARLYPDESREGLREAIDLERSLGTLASRA